MAGDRNTALLITHHEDHYTIDLVAAALRAFEMESVRLDADRFPTEVRLSTQLNPGALTCVLEDGRTRLDMNRVAAVWIRKLWPPRIADNLDPRFRDACQRESQAALNGFFDNIRGVRWVSDLNAIRRADNKLHQLRLAAEAGLTIPRTLVSNDPDEVRRFCAALGGPVVVKLMRALSSSMGRAPMFVYTSELRKEDLAALDQLRHCPMVFQERIDKARELRVIYVDGETFVGAIDASASQRGTVDWRLAEPGEARWVSDTLPPDVAACVDRFVRRLRLVYGALDFIRTPAGEHVFLEVNPTGEWGMLQRDLGFPIAEAIARALSQTEPDNE